MARHNDSGAYAAGNVRIVLNGTNAAEAVRVRGLHRTT